MRCGTLSVPVVNNGEGGNPKEMAGDSGGGM